VKYLLYKCIKTARILNNAREYKMFQELGFKYVKDSVLITYVKDILEIMSHKYHIIYKSDG